jgi:very-short-patch-repair endonuclease
MVFTYCAVGSPHDQYFYKRPARMVAGAVSAPRIDLANEDLVRAHVHALWLAETGEDLGQSLKDLLDLEGTDPTLELLDGVQQRLGDAAARARARSRAQIVIQGLVPRLEDAGWYSPGWLDEVLAQVMARFDKACTRWRDLYRGAASQYRRQSDVIGDATRTKDEKDRARRLRREAEAQMELLTDAKSVMQSDFYSYRYFASEGFLPGYSFPRLPVSAFIPARQTKRGEDEYLSRPRFLAISEFGPRAIVYHEGSRYEIDKVIRAAGDDEVATTQVKLCEKCGYLHPIPVPPGPDVCDHCRQPLPAAMTHLFRLQNVSTRRRDRITSDEEERQRLGYELKTGVRFAVHDDRPLVRSAEVRGDDDQVLAQLTYGHAATLWRINFGWTRRKNKAVLGFVLDLTNGRWSRKELLDDRAPDEPEGPKAERVIPFVDDTRNCLALTPAGALELPAMASLQAALKSAIQIEYQLEDSELAAEPLPGRDERRALLFYESAEGGAGVLRHLVDDAAALARVARRALELIHVDPDTGDDRGAAPGARERCEKACYDCLMGYGNQWDHRNLDRFAIRGMLQALARGTVEASPVGLPRALHLQRLLDRCDSELERDWLRFLEARALRLPTRSQVSFAAAHTKPDFVYEDQNGTTAVYVDGPVHDHPDRHARDVTQTAAMEDLGVRVLRFHHADDWPSLVAANPSIFGCTP